jgi:hypothetical protein
MLCVTRFDLDVDGSFSIEIRWTSTAEIFAAQLLVWIGIAPEVNQGRAHLGR